MFTKSVFAGSLPRWRLSTSQWPLSLCKPWSRATMEKSPDFSKPQLKYNILHLLVIKMMKFVKTQENAPKFIVSIMPPIVHMFTMFTLCHTYTITPSHMYVMFACTYCSQVCSVHMYTMLACTQWLHVHMHRCNNNTIRECFQTCTQCPHNCRMLKK